MLGVAFAGVDLIGMTGAAESCRGLTQQGDEVGAMRYMAQITFARGQRRMRLVDDCFVIVMTTVA